MGTIYYDNDADLDLVRARRVGIIGYGNQGHAHAQNLRDSGCQVRVGLSPEGRSWIAAEADGFVVQSVAEVAEWADLISVLLPDQFHRTVYEESIHRYLTPGKMILVAHGFSIHYAQIEPPWDVDAALVAPIGPGHMMRRLYRQRLGEPALLAVRRDATGQAEGLALSYAAGLGCTRAGVVRTTFNEETEANLIGEQAVLGGGVPDLIKAGFDRLVAAGYQEEVAYFECVHTVKLIVDLIYENGLAAMRSRISDTAAYGSYLTGPRVVDDHVRESLGHVLQDIQDGSFARQWISEYGQGAPELDRLRVEAQSERVEAVGRKLRSMISWLDGHRPMDPLEHEALT